MRVGQHALRDDIGGVAGQDDDGKKRSFSPDLFPDFLTAHLGHGQVEQYNVNMIFPENF